MYVCIRGHVCRPHTLDGAQAMIWHPCTVQASRHTFRVANLFEIAESCVCTQKDCKSHGEL